ncbi:RNA polymerase II mediator complex component Med8, putative [Glarea lozoyensis ATCC 20868]|uniref:Mediator of RNA polymerase II transcription subunit 8 n=2 Tax=Glarea lozoyensis TaxID=101852 RepID=S3DIJ9_GLAL2|nr:RNA polymerase II mediator complex component Med8, putative [Glarea lozoyensis ATCC 20868]EHK96055.1 putative Mediator of RNA polymerase II transcription subunit 8 [Glarea lozoyensis 74030]EPE31841.1 RNA polymerase II mediator complex component Med8, putative [Glarea lozoyensis ATCC 20868]
MAYASLTPEELKALDATRQKFFQLTSSIQSLKNDLARTHPLPQWSSLQVTTAMLSNYMDSITRHLAEHSELMNKVVVYPSTNYPGREQEGLLGMLLRKKLEPPVEALVEEAREIEIKNPKAVSQENEEFADWAAGWIHQRVATAAQSEMVENFTQDERIAGVENVRTGLRRKIDLKPPKIASEEEESSEEEGSEDEEMEDAGLDTAPTRPVEFGMGTVRKNPNALVRTEDDILRFATNGATSAPAAPPSTLNTVWSVGKKAK